MTALGIGIEGAATMNGEIMVDSYGIIGGLGHPPTFLVIKRVYARRRQVPHLEVAASGSGLVVRYYEKGRSNVMTSAKALGKMTESGDPPVSGTCRETGRETGRAPETIVNIFDPELATVGGGLGNSDEPWQGALHEVYREQLMDVPRGVPVVKARSGNQAALMGTVKKI